MRKRIVKGIVLFLVGFAFLSIRPAEVYPARFEESLGARRMKYTDLSQDYDFSKTVFQALRALRNVEPIQGMEGYYLLKEPNVALCTLLVEELKRLPFNNESGQTILMREDAREVIEGLIKYIERNIEIVTKGGKWNSDSFAEIRGFFRLGFLQVFKNEIYEDTGLEGIGYNVDLGINYVGGISGNPSDFMIKLERYQVQQNPFQVTRSSSIELHLLYGVMIVELDDTTLPRPHTSLINPK